MDEMKVVTDKSFKRCSSYAGDSGWVDDVNGTKPAQEL